MNMIGMIKPPMAAFVASIADAMYEASASFAAIRATRATGGVRNAKTAKNMTKKCACSKPIPIFIKAGAANMDTMKYAVREGPPKPMSTHTPAMMINATKRYPPLQSCMPEESFTPTPLMVTVAIMSPTQAADAPIPAPALAPLTKP